MSPACFSRKRSVPLAVASLLLLAPAVSAQDVSITGRVIGPAAEPIAGQPVLLHRVTDEGGALLSQSTTDDEGRFTLRAAPKAPGTGVYFVAVRYRDQLHIGPLFRHPFPDGQEYVVRLGSAGVSDLTDLSATASDSTQTPRSAIWFGVGLILSAIGAGTYLTLYGSARSRRRRALMQVARLDERFAGAKDPPASYSRSRRRVLQRAVRSGE